MFELFSLLILSHVLADFPFQFDFISSGKRENKLYLWFHILIHFIFSVLLTLSYFSFQLLMGLLLLSLIHGVIDTGKIYIQKYLSKEDNKESRYFLELFIVDQLLHIAVIGWFVSIVQGFDFFSVGKGLLENLLSILPFVSIDFIIQLNEAAVILAFAVLIFSFKGGTIIVRALLHKYNTEISGQGDKGMAIGNLERLLIIFFVIFGTYSLIGFVFTAKSVIRFRGVNEQPEPDFIEYYLIGSFSSIFLGLIFGFAVRYLVFV